MDEGRVGEEGVGGKGVPEGEVEEAEGEVGVVADSEGDLGNLPRSEAVGVEGADFIPAGFGAVVLED